MPFSSEKSQLQANVLIVIPDFIKTNKMYILCVFLHILLLL